MTGTDRPDDGLAPVTDLFGGRRGSSPNADAERRAGAEQRPDVDRPTDAEQRPDVDRPTDAEQRADAGRPAGAELPADAALRPDRSAADAGHLSPVVPIRERDPEWLPPVTGQERPRSAGATDSAGGSSETAPAERASVFSIVDGDELGAADAPRARDEQLADAERISMRTLGRRGVSVSELRKTLLAQDLDPDVVEHELERLQRVQLLDDAALAAELVDRLHRRKSLGRQGVAAELRRRGIDQAAIDTALDADAEDDESADDAERATELAVKRAGQMRGLDRATAERRLSGYLMRKGYGGGIVRVAVAQALDGSGRRGSVRFE